MHGLDPRRSPIPLFGEEPACARRRPVCRCVRDSHYAAEYFIHKRAEQLPYSTNVWRHRATEETSAIALARLRTRAYCTPPLVVAAAITRGAAAGAVNETRPHTRRSFASFALPPPSFSALPRPSVSRSSSSSSSSRPTRPIDFLRAGGNDGPSRLFARQSRETNSQDSAETRLQHQHQQQLLLLLLPRETREERRPSAAIRVGRRSTTTKECEERRRCGMHACGALLASRGCTDDEQEYHRVRFALGVWIPRIPTITSQSPSVHRS